MRSILLNPLPTLALSMVLAAMLPTSRAAVDDAPPPISLGRSVLKLEARRVQGGFALGSAVVVAPGELVTNCHVTRDANLLQVMYGGQRWTVDSQSVDAEHDLCLLRVPGLPANPVTLGSSRSLQPGQRVNAVGYTGGMALQATGGEVVALHRLDGGDVVQSSNWFTSGASGGALFDAEQRLVGVLTFRMPGGESHYFAAPVEWLQGLQARSSAAVAPLADRSLPYWQRPAELQPRFLQALRLLRDNQWPALTDLSRDWRRDDQSDPEPWYLAGLAFNRQGRLSESRQALRCATRLDPRLRAATSLVNPLLQDLGLGGPVADTGTGFATTASTTVSTTVSAAISTAAATPLPQTAGDERLCLADPAK